MSAQETTPPVWTQQFVIRAHDVDFNRNASVEKLCQYFLDAAWNHAEKLGVGFHALERRGQFWVLSRLLLQISRRPLWGDGVTLETWPRTAKSVFAMRDFRMADSHGETLVLGASAWLVLDSKTRKPQRLDRISAEIGLTNTDRALDREPAKLPALPVHQPGLNIKVRYSDIDVNGHVNSARYVGWLMDAYPLEWHRRNGLRSIDLNYLAETMDGETLGLGCDQSSPDGHLFSLVSLRHSVEACRARLIWQTDLKT